MQDLKIVATFQDAGLQSGLANVQKGLAKTAVEANKLDSALAKNLTKGSNTAGQSLINLGRIAQDAPFGFIGIQNNINPLLESFQRLKVETGSAGGAFKALASSLVGGAGIGLAVSLATSALTFLAQSGFFKSKKAADDGADANKKYKESLDSITSSIAGEQAKVDQIVNALKTEVLTRAQRAEAINQLQKASPQYFATLDRENATIDQITIAYNRYSASILRAVEARVREKQLTDITEKILKLKDQASNLGQDEVIIAGKLVKVSRQRLDTESQSLSAAEAYQATIAGTLSLTSAENKELLELEKTRARLLKLVTEAKGVEQFNVIDKTALKKDAKDAAKTIQEEINKITPVKFFKEDIIKDSKDFIKNLPQITIPVVPKIDAGKASLRPFLKDITDEANAIGETMAESIASGFGDTIGLALAGKASVGDIFSGIFQSLGDSLSALGNLFIQTGIQVAIFKKLIINNPALAIAAGVALKVLGAFVKARTASAGFATGGRVDGQTITVGERGRELLTVPRGTVITPNAQTNAILGAGQNVFINGELKAKGSELILVLDRATQTQRRNT
jgi:hypothetical protein